MGSFTIDESKWPLVEIAIKGEFGLSDTEQLCSRLLVLGQRQERFINLFDMRDCITVSADARRYFSQHAKSNQKLFGLFLISAICIIESRLIRGVLTAMGWLFPFPHPVRPVSTPSAAYELANDFFSKEGIRLNQ